MRRRIFFHNTVTVVLALVIVLAVTGGVLHWVDRAYRDPPGGPPVLAVQEVKDCLDSWTGEDWPALGDELRELGFSLFVCRGEEEVYSTLDAGQRQLLELLAAGGDWLEGSASLFRSDGIPVLGVTEGDYSITALPQGGYPEILGRWRPQSEAMIVALLVSGVLSIALIAALNLLFTKVQLKHIMRPVQALTDAARRIEAGDYATPVDYAGKDEFSAVCAAFDQMQSHLLAQREKNAAYERARTDLVAGISHDLRTPLTSVKGYIKGLRDGVAATPEKQRQYLDVAYRKACEMEKLLQRLFYFSKMETGNLPLFREETDLGRFAARFVADTAGEVDQAGGSMTLDAQPGPHPVSIDTEQMTRVLANLTSNALRYAGADPLRLTLSVRREGTEEVLRFADNGVGVPPEQLGQLFQQFWRGDAARRSQGGSGSGLGLYIAKYIVEAHGGRITPSLDGGLVFTIALPRQEELS